MMTFYAAVGSYRIRKENGRLVPHIQKLGRLHPISIPEFVIWSTLLWEVMTYQELKEQYDKQMTQIQGPAPDFDPLAQQTAFLPTTEKVDDATLAMIALRFLDGYLQRQCKHSI